jgi:CubicO group peptidase (beta-lactamase class C family)
MYRRNCVSVSIPVMMSLLSLHAPCAMSQEAGPRLMPNQPIPAAELEAFIDGVVTARMAQDRIAGVAVSVVQGGELRLAKGYGFADLETGRRVDPDATLFRIGSITKTFTYIALMRLVEAGELALDDAVNDHLPPELRIPDEGFDEPIRLRDLLTHQPGFEDRALGVLFAETPGEIRPLGEFLRDTRPARVRPPGELSSYSNYGIGLLGAVIEQATGRRWQGVIEADILAPLGMTRTSPREPYPARDDLPAPMAVPLAQGVAVGYRPAGGGHVEQSFEYITQVAPAGVMSSTASDMARYMQMLLNGGELDGSRIFGARAARAFRTPMTSLPPEVGSWDAGFAEFPTSAGLRAYGHDGATLAFFSSMIIVPELDLGVFVATNTAGGAALTGSLWVLIEWHFYGPPIPAPLAGAPEQRAAMAEYAGQYLPTRRQYGGLAGFLMRAQAATIGVSPDGYLTLSGPQGPQRFVPTGEPDRFRAANGPGLIEFERRDGRLVLPTIGMAFEKAGLLQSSTILIALSVLAVLAAIGSLIGVRIRAGRGLPSTRAQRRAGQLLVGAAMLWIASLASLAVFAAGVASNANQLVFSWPTPSIVLFSTLALFAALVSWTAVGFLPMVWRGGAGWTRWRKLRYSAAVVLFGVLALILLGWGALQPWNP